MHKIKFLATALSIGIVLALPGCQETPAQRAERDNHTRQMDVKARATTQVPAVVIDNYVARDAVAEYMHRVDNPGQVWYVYKVTRDKGIPVKAYTSSIHPMSICSFMTPPEEIKRAPNSSSYHHVTTAMALDGLYYKGGECGTFFFDLTTGTLVVLDEDSVVEAYDRPLDMEIEFTRFATIDPELQTLANARAQAFAEKMAARTAEAAPAAMPAENTEEAPAPNPAVTP